MRVELEGREADFDDITALKEASGMISTTNIEDDSLLQTAAASKLRPPREDN